MADSPDDNDLLENDDFDDDDDGPAPTPFDHPMFLPVLLVAGALWFGYDGFINQDPNMLEHSGFNRIGFVGLVIGALYLGRSGLREMREDRERDASDRSE